MWRVLLALLLLTPDLAAAQSVWVEATGHAAQNGAADADAARRRALADAMLQAAFAGGAAVEGHTAVAMGTVTSDLAIVRAVGRVLETQVLQQSSDGTLWNVRIRARVGPAAEATCAGRPVLVTMFQPAIHVSTRAPAWAEPLSQDIAARLRDEIARQPGVQLQAISGRGQPTMPGSAPGRDYISRTQGELRLAPGQHGLTASIDIGTAARGLSGKSLTLDMTLALTDGQGWQNTERLQSAVALPGVSALGNVAVLAQPGRDRLAADLTAGVEDTLARLVRQVHCAPVSIFLELRGKQIVAPVGRANGLSRGAIAFTEDRDNSTEMLEIVELGRDYAILRPLDPQRPAKAFAGRPVRFLETAQ